MRAIVAVTGITAKGTDAAPLGMIPVARSPQPLFASRAFRGPAVQSLRSDGHRRIREGSWARADFVVDGCTGASSSADRHQIPSGTHVSCAVARQGAQLVKGVKAVKIMNSKKTTH